MKDINTVSIVGRLTRDAECKYTHGGLPIVSFSIASNYSKKDRDGKYQDEANFFDCVKIGAGSEGVAPHLTKGKQVAIQGELRQDRWEKDGQKHSRVKIDVYHLQLLGGSGEARARPDDAALDSTEGGGGMSGAISCL